MSVFLNIAFIFFFYCNSLSQFHVHDNLLIIDHSKNFKTFGVGVMVKSEFINGPSP
jgi:hypothetical protein